MAHRVRCKVTKEYGTSDTFYRAPNGDYYKTEQIYLEKQKRTEMHKKLIHKFADTLGYSAGMVFPTVLAKEIKELSFYGDEIIYETLVACDKSIQHAFQVKTFNSDTCRVQYMMAIIKNNINDVYRAHKRTEQQLKKIEHMVDVADIPDVLVQNETASNNSRDISGWIGDDD